MKKKEMRLLVASLVECGKGLGLATLMPDGKAKEEGTRILNEQIDATCKQLELFCEDVDYKELTKKLEEITA